MFDWLKEILHEIWQHLLPFFVINSYEEGVRLRLGKSIRKPLKPGFHFKIPLVDEIHSVIVTPDTFSAKAIHVTTTDDKTISVSPTVVFSIADSVKYLLDTNDASSNFHDIVRSCTSDYMSDIEWIECKKKTTKTQIKKLLNKSCEDLGIVIHEVMLTDICLCRVIITQI